MTDQLYCTRGCTRWDKHLTDCDATDDNPCRGCEPRPVDVGYLCTRCLRRLETLLDTPDNRESVAGAHFWLSTNMGQHLRTTTGGKPTGDGSTTGDHLVTVMTAMDAIQGSLLEMAEEFTTSRSMRLGTDLDPEAVTDRLRPWLTTLADWEPINDHIDHLTDLINDAHAVAPWRGKDPNAGEKNAAVLYLAPPETTDQICARFGLVRQWLWDARRRKGLEPVEDNVKPLRWRPWLIFEILHPGDAKRYEAKLAREARLAEHGEVVWSSEDTPSEVA